MSMSDILAALLLLLVLVHNNNYNNYNNNKNNNNNNKVFIHQQIKNTYLSLQVSVRNFKKVKNEN